MPGRSEIVAEARRWIGTRWRHQGRTSNGVDCVGLLARVGAALGCTSYDFVAYQRRPGDSQTFLQHFHKAGCLEIPMNSARPGDILIFQDNQYPCHCGILSEKRGTTHFIHSHASWKKVVEQPLDATWTALRTHAFVMPGADD